MTRWSDESARVSIWRRYFIDIIYRCQAQPIWSERKGCLARARESENERKKERARERQWKNKKKEKINTCLPDADNGWWGVQVDVADEWIKSKWKVCWEEIEREREKYMFASMSGTNKLATFIRVIERLKPKKKEWERGRLRWTIIISNERNERKKTWESATGTLNEMDGEYYIYISEGEWEQETQGEFPK